MSKTNLFDLDGKIAFVSGASRGIGAAIAMLLAQQGAHVIISSRRIESCEAVAEAITAAGGKPRLWPVILAKWIKSVLFLHRFASSLVASIF